MCVFLFCYVKSDILSHRQRCHFLLWETVIHLKLAVRSSISVRCWFSEHLLSRFVYIIMKTLMQTVANLLGKLIPLHLVGRPHLPFLSHTVGHRNCSNRKTGALRWRNVLAGFFHSYAVNILKYSTFCPKSFPIEISGWNVEGYGESSGPQKSLHALHFLCKTWKTWSSFGKWNHKEQWVWEYELWGARWVSGAPSSCPIGSSESRTSGGMFHL